MDNILYHKSSKIPLYFIDQYVPIISYTYTKQVAIKNFQLQTHIAGSQH